MKIWKRPKTLKNDIFGFQNDHFGHLSRFLASFKISFSNLPHPNHDSLIFNFFKSRWGLWRSARQSQIARATGCLFWYYRLRPDYLRLFIWSNEWSRGQWSNSRWSSPNPSWTNFHSKSNRSWSWNYSNCRTGRICRSHSPNFWFWRQYRLWKRRYAYWSTKVLISLKMIV